jgi:hypothetical protein
MMNTKEIAREKWFEFCDSFSRMHKGWLVSICSRGQIVARDVPLQGIVADLNGDGRSSILILAGKSAADHVTYTVAQPSALKLEEAEEGRHKSLLIETPEGTTKVKFRVAVLPEEVDGV